MRISSRIIFDLQRTERKHAEELRKQEFLKLYKEKLKEEELSHDK